MSDSELGATFPQRKPSVARVIEYLCACGRRISCCAFADSPVEARHRCPFCNRTNVVKTTESFSDIMDPFVRECEDRRRISKRRSVVISREQMRREVEMVARKLQESDRPVVQTKLGPATLIG